MAVGQFSSTCAQVHCLAVAQKPYNYNGDTDMAAGSVGEVTA